MKTHYIKNGDLTLAVHQFGKRNTFKEPLFFTTPGWGLSSVEYYLTLEYLFDDFEFYFIDSRGSGQSEGPAELNEYKFEYFCEDFEAIRKHFGLEKINFIGHSFGGVLAMEYALRYPESIGKLCILCSYATKDVEYTIRYDQAIERMSKEDWFGGVQAFRDSVDVIDTEKKLNDYVLGILPMYFTDQEAYKKALPLFEKGSVSFGPFNGIQKCYPGYSTDLLGRIKEIEVPTKIICGSDDFICPADDNLRIHHEIEGSSFSRIEHVGHFPWIEKPNVFSSALKSFFKE